MRLDVTQCRLIRRKENYLRAVLCRVQTARGLADLKGMEGGKRSNFNTVCGKGWQMSDYISKRKEGDHSQRCAGVDMNCTGM